MTMERLTLSSLAISCVTVIGSASKILSISHCQLRMTGHCAPLLQGSVSLANLLEPPLHCTFISSSAKRLFVLWLVFAALWPILNLNKKTAWICFLSNIIEVKWSEIKLLSPVRLWDPRDYSVHGILQAKILEWVAFPSSRGSSQPRDRTQVSRIADGFLTSWATREA